MNTQNPPIPVPEGWRLLRPTETIVRGDKCHNGVQSAGGGWGYVSKSIGSCPIQHAEEYLNSDFFVIREDLRES